MRDDECSTSEENFDMSFCIGDDEALNNLESVYVDCDRLDLAADCYMNALNINITRAHQGLARVYNLKNQRKAAYDEMTILMDDHKEAEAISELSKAISFKPDLQLFHLRVAFHDSMGDYISPCLDCEAALCLDPIHTDTIELYHRA
ncbi:hypothetical protein RHMOL_Rhmol05G0309600 [Rhododendron molle]|uniref:Uncharacterized protein n=1 Tax=Rhododendron molle TaxID=49168 RepID=A0ACC0NV11_RHOML|nr:hypothetical protein RHMOL_Rhmol05G0309600 [Rhododendron molle]